jgi:hypothetical protein
MHPTPGTVEIETVGNEPEQRYPGAEDAGFRPGGLWAVVRP